MGFPTTMFLEHPPSEVICSICHDVMKYPRTERCGHSFCRDCLRSWSSTKIVNRDSYPEQGESPCCPLCRKKIVHFLRIPNLALENLIGKLQVSCPYHVLVTESSPKKESSNITREAASLHHCNEDICNDHYAVSMCNWKGSLAEWVQHHSARKSRKDIPYHLRGGREKAEEYVKNTNEYMKLLEHASSCKHVPMTCPTAPKKCLKMKKALEHLPFCQPVVKNKKANTIEGEKACKLCKHLSISIQMHARICKKDPSDCAVPNCSVFKAYYNAATKNPKPKRQVITTRNPCC